MKKKLFFGLALVLCTPLVFGLTSCKKEKEKEPVVEDHVCAHVCPICQKCTDPNCTDPVCADKCQGHVKALTGIETDIEATSVYYLTTKLAENLNYRRVYSDGTFGEWEQFGDQEISEIKIENGKITAKGTIEVKNVAYTANIELPIAEAVDVNTMIGKENGTKGAVKGIYVAHQSSSSRSVIVLFDKDNNKTLNVSIFDLSEDVLNTTFTAGDELYLPIEFGKQGDICFATFTGSNELLSDAILSQGNDYSSWDGKTTFSTVSSIAIKSMPETVVYGHRDTLETIDLVGGTLQVTYSDGVVTELDITRSMLPEVDNLWKIGTVNYPVTFEGCETILPITYENHAMSVDDFVKEEGGTYDVEGIVVASASSRAAIELIIKSTTTSTVVGVYNSGMAGSWDAPYLSGIEEGDKVILSLKRMQIVDDLAGGSTGKYYADYESMMGVITLEKNCPTTISFQETPYTTISTQEELREFVLNHEEGFEDRYYSFVKFTANMMCIYYDGNYRIFFDPAIKDYYSQVINYENTSYCSPIFDGYTCKARLGNDWQSQYFNNPSSISYANPATPKSSEIYALFVGGNLYYQTFVVLDPSWIKPVTVTDVELNDTGLKSMTADAAVDNLKYRLVYSSGSTGIWQPVEKSWCGQVSTENDTFKFEVVIPVGDKTYTKNAVIAVDKHVHAFTLQNATSAALASAATCQAKARYYYSCECGDINTSGETFEFGELADHLYPVIIQNEQWVNSNVCDYCHQVVGEITPASIKTMTEVKAASDGTMIDYTEAVVVGFAGDNNGLSNKFTRYLLISDGTSILVLDMYDGNSAGYFKYDGFKLTYVSDNTVVKVGDKLLISNLKRIYNRYCLFVAGQSTVTHVTPIDVNQDGWFHPALDEIRTAAESNLGAFDIGCVYQITATADSPLYINGIVSTLSTGLGNDWLAIYGAGNGNLTVEALAGHTQTDMLYKINDNCGRYPGSSAAIVALNLGNDWLVNNFGDTFKVEDGVLTGELNFVNTPLGAYPFEGTCYVVQTYGYTAGNTYVNTVILSAGNTLKPVTVEHVHNFTIQNATENTLATPATCTAKATYYYSCSCGVVNKSGETFESGELADHYFPTIIKDGGFVVSNVCDYCKQTIGEEVAVTPKSISEVKNAAENAVIDYVEAVVVGFAGDNNGLVNTYVRYLLVSDGTSILVFDMADANSKPFFKYNGISLKYVSDDTDVAIGDKLLITNLQRIYYRYCLFVPTSKVDKVGTVNVHADGWFNPTADVEFTAAEGNFGPYDSGLVYKITATKENPLYINGIVSGAALNQNWITIYGAGNGSINANTLEGNVQTNMLYNTGSCLRYVGSSAAITALNQGNNWLVSNFGESFALNQGALEGQLDLANSTLGTYAFTGTLYYVPLYGWTGGTTYLNTCLLGVGNTLTPYVSEHVHAFTVENAIDEAIATPATCTILGTYYYSCSCGLINKEGSTFTGTEYGHVFPTYIKDGVWTVSNVCSVCVQTIGEEKAAEVATMTEVKDAAENSIIAHTEAVVVGIGGDNNGIVNTYARYLLISDGTSILVLDMADANSKPFFAYNGFSLTYVIDSTEVKIGDKILISDLKRIYNRYCLFTSTSTVTKVGTVDVYADGWFTPVADVTATVAEHNFGDYTAGLIYKVEATVENPLYINGLVSNTGLGNNWLAVYGSGNANITPETLATNDASKIAYTVNANLSRRVGESAAIAALNMGNEWLVNNFGDSFVLNQGTLEGALDVTNSTLGTYAFTGTFYYVCFYGWTSGVSYLNTVMLGLGNTLQRVVVE